MPRLRRFRISWLSFFLILIMVVAAGGWGARRWFSHGPRAVSNSSSGQLASASNETSWPQLRGPTFDSHSSETGLAESWPEEGPPVVWTRELGQGYSGFTAVGDRVYTQCQSLYRQSVLCLDVATGHTIWSYDYGWPYEGGGLYPGPRGTPTWNSGRVYFAAPDGTIGCLDAGDGHLIWSCNPKKTYRGRGTDFGYACSPVVVDNHVIIPVGGVDASVVALDPRDGSTIWKSGTSSASYATPLPIHFEGQSLVVTPLENSVAAFEVETGTLQWEIEFSEGYDEHSAAPIYQEPFLFLASPFRAGAKRFRLIDGEVAASAGPEEQHAAGSPKLTWESPRFSNDVASSVLVDGRVYGFDLKDPQSRLDRPSRGEFRCVDFETGSIVWSTPHVGQANAIVADQKLILFTDRGELILARLRTDEYVELARTQVFRDEICWTYPALHRGCVYLRTQTRAACIYLGKEPHDTRHPAILVRDIPRGTALDVKWLIGGEREYPATVPDWGEFRVWYQWSLCGLILSSVAAGLMQLGVRFAIAVRQRNRSENHATSNINFRTVSPTTIGRGCFWLTAAISGVIGSPVANSLQSEYVLLWPLALWVAFQLTINMITWTERQLDRRRLRWLSRGCGLMFVGTCATYFHLCRSLGYAIEWSFLIGFLPAFVVAAGAARFLTTRSRYWLMTDWIFSSLSFSAYFWSSVVFIKWKMIVGS